MTYTKTSIYETSLPIVIVNRNDIYDEFYKYATQNKSATSKYPLIGLGEEGIVYKYDNKKAFKIFDTFEERQKLTQKFAKIEELARLKDKNFCFPLGLVGYLDLKKEGYYMDLVDPNKICANFSELRKLSDMRKVLEYLMLAEKAIKRIHKKGIILGDIKEDNIMIDKDGNVKFIDTDNYAYLEYDFDLLPSRACWLEHTYNKPANRIDNDIFVFTLMALEQFMPIWSIKLHHNKTEEYFKMVTSLLNASPEVKEGIGLLLSDAPNKPYPGKVLKLINPDEPLFSSDAIEKLS